MIRLFILGTVIFTFGFMTKSSAQFWKQHNGFEYAERQPHHYYPNYYQPRQYQQQDGFQNNLQLPPGISISEADWICRNSKTGDMVNKIISFNIVCRFNK